MREIKFRAWDKNGNTMAYSNDRNQFYAWFTDNDGNMICAYTESIHKLDNVMQYTGLKDKNDKEIYEGDILKQNGNDKDLVQICFGKFKIYDIETEQVIDIAYGWYMKAIATDELSRIEPFCYDMPLNDDWINSFGSVVISNIYENPELLRR